MTVRHARAAALLVAGTLLAACGSDIERVEIGSAAPAYSAPTLAGDSIALTDLRGTPVLLNVWATWCIPCREEMPALQSLQDDYGARGLRVVGVSIDQTRAADDVRAFMEEHDIGFTILHDPASRVTHTFRTVGVPETLLIDADGVLRARWIGQVSGDQIRPALEELFAG